MLTKTQYQYTLQDTDTKRLFEWVPRIMAALAKSPNFQDVTSDLQIAGPEVDIQLDRNAIAAVGITVDQVEDALYTAFGPRQISTIYTATDDYWVLMQVDPTKQNDSNVLDELYLHGANDHLVPLSAITHIVKSVGPSTIAL